MRGLNAEFINNPKLFLDKYLVDNTVLQQGGDGAATIEILNVVKEGIFDFQPGGEGRVIFSVVGPKTMAAVEDDVGIPGYWCPFLAGGGQPGWVDVPRADPPRRFVFTAAMQGCWFVITSASEPAGCRVHHNQHPEKSSTWEAMEPQGQPISTLRYQDYGDPAGEASAAASNAFNLMVYPHGGPWTYLSQSHVMVPGERSFTVARDDRFPVLQRSTGV